MSLEIKTVWLFLPMDVNYEPLCHGSTPPVTIPFHLLTPVNNHTCTFTPSISLLLSIQAKSLLSKANLLWYSFLSLRCDFYKDFPRCLCFCTFSNEDKAMPGVQQGSGGPRAWVILLLLPLRLPKYQLLVFFYFDDPSQSFHRLLFISLSSTLRPHPELNLQSSSLQSRYSIASTNTSK